MKHMRLLIPLSLLAGALLVFPAAAGAGNARPYNGELENDPTTAIGFGVPRDTPHKEVSGIFIEDMPYACWDGTVGRFDRDLGGSFRVRHGRFGGKGKATGVTYEIHGRLLKHGKARGTLSVKPALVETTFCYTGTLAWRAEAS